MSAPGKSTTPHQGGPSSGPHQGPIKALIRAGLPGRGTQRVPCGHRALTRRRPRPLRQPSPSRSSHSPSPAPAPTPPPFPSVAAWPACAATHARVRVASPVRGGASPVSAAAARLPASLAAQCASSRRRSAERVTGPGAGHGPRSGGTGARGGGRGGAALSCGASLRPSSPDTRAHRPRSPSLRRRCSAPKPAPRHNRHTIIITPPSVSRALQRLQFPCWPSTASLVQAHLAVSCLAPALSAPISSCLPPLPGPHPHSRSGPHCAAYFSMPAARTPSAAPASTLAAPPSFRRGVPSSAGRVCLRHAFVLRNGGPVLMNAGVSASDTPRA